MTRKKVLFGCIVFPRDGEDLKLGVTLRQGFPLTPSRSLAFGDGQPAVLGAQSLLQHPDTWLEMQSLTQVLTLTLVG
jgi:hypothetical protein